jgi:hypothetical protein
LVSVGELDHGKGGASAAQGGVAATAQGGHGGTGLESDGSIGGAVDGGGVAGASGGQAGAGAGGTTAGGGGSTDGSAQGGTAGVAGSGGSPLCVLAVTDDFNAGVLNPSVWTTAISGTGTSSVEEKNGHLVASVLLQQPGAATALAETVGSWSIDDCTVQIEAVALTGTGQIFAIAASSGDRADFYRYATTITFSVLNAGAYHELGNVTYDPIAHRYWRFRADSTGLTWEASPDKLQWAQLAQTTNLFAGKVIRVLLGVDREAVGASTAEFDNLDLP